LTNSTIAHTLAIHTHSKNHSLLLTQAKKQQGTKAKMKTAGFKQLQERPIYQEQLKTNWKEFPT
jgi:hypothetical protein